MLRRKEAHTPVLYLEEYLRKGKLCVKVRGGPPTHSPVVEGPGASGDVPDDDKMMVGAPIQ